ncbi:MAG: ferritin-like domain-containing protein [Verrucomicrobiae bacterium]|nr:ferritin-like domain-containing protein [Verrucomicrobiae bacterium]
MKIDSLQKLFEEELKDVYDAENQLLKALPKMAKAATSQELKDAFNEHLEQTKGHVERLEQVFEELELPAKGKTCKAMKGLIQEGSEILKEKGDSAVIDAALIVAAQKVEHYEIASYGSLRTFANLLGHEDAAETLQETLDEEEETDKKLTELAEEIINEQAAESEDQEEEVESKK